MTMPARRPAGPPRQLLPLPRQRHLMRPPWLGEVKDNRPGSSPSGPLVLCKLAPNSGNPPWLPVLYR